jgi:hypothetical protein
MYMAQQDVRLQVALGVLDTRLIAAVMAVAAAAVRVDIQAVAAAVQALIAAPHPHLEVADQIAIIQELPIHYFRQQAQQAQQEEEAQQVRFMEMVPKVIVDQSLYIPYRMFSHSLL